MPTKVADKVLSWASDLDPNTIAQASKTARLPFIAGHIALMPDAHVGIGSTVGSVIPTKDTIIPAAIGVDIGCGMIALETSLNAAQLPDDLDKMLPDIESAIPAGVGKGHQEPSKAAYDWFNLHHSRFSDKLTPKMADKCIKQFGTLGSGNHFFEICLDERDMVWIVLHSGSRGLGNMLAQQHMKAARKLMDQLHIALEDKDLAYLVQDTPEFDAYIMDMKTCQDYAFANRERMMSNAYMILNIATKGQGIEVNRINCHHNFTEQEQYGKNKLWITRKGAIRAAVGDLGIIPGSMGTRSYIVSGLGNRASWNSCSHGAGRRFSRTKAKETFSVEDLKEQMQGKIWQESQALSLLDEIPSAYKDVDQVMRDQADLVEVLHTLTQVLNYKGC